MRADEITCAAQAAGQIVGQMRTEAAGCASTEALIRTAQLILRRVRKLLPSPVERRAFLAKHFDLVTARAQLAERLKVIDALQAEIAALGAEETKP